MNDIVETQVTTAIRAAVNQLVDFNSVVEYHTFGEGDFGKVNKFRAVVYLHRNEGCEFRDNPHEIEIVVPEYELSKHDVIDFGNLKIVLTNLRSKDSVSITASEAFDSDAFVAHIKRLIVDA